MFTFAAKPSLGGKAMNKACWGNFPNGVSRGLIEKPPAGNSSRLVDSAALVLMLNVPSASRRTNVLVMQCLSVLANVQASDRRKVEKLPRDRFLEIDTQRVVSIFPEWRAALKTVAFV